MDAGVCVCMYRCTCMYYVHMCRLLFMYVHMSMGTRMLFFMHQLLFSLLREGSLAGLELS